MLSKYLRKKRNQCKVEKETDAKKLNNKTRKVVEKKGKKSRKNFW